MSHVVDEYYGSPKPGHENPKALKLRVADAIAIRIRPFSPSLIRVRLRRPVHHSGGACTTCDVHADAGETGCARIGGTHRAISGAVAKGKASSNRRTEVAEAFAATNSAS